MPTAPLARGSSYLAVHGQLYSPEKRETAEFQAQLAAELADTAACRRAALAGLDTVLRLVSDAAADVRRQATSTARVLVALPEATEAQRAAVADVVPPRPTHKP